jgi:pimeloyl-ACP methyl ester carboxylesterase
MKSEWIFIRGLARHSLHWGSFPKYFSNHFPESKVRCLDLPGMGENREERSPRSVSEIAKWLNRRYDLDASQGPLYLFSLSLGGMVALEWMRQAPDLFQGAVLINSSLGGISPLFQRLQPAGWSTFSKAFTLRDPLEREKCILEWVSNRPEIQEQCLPNWARWAQEQEISKRNVLRQFLAAACYRLSVTLPMKNILLLRSLGDRLCHPSCSSDIQKLLQCDMKTHESAGHDLTLDEPDWVCAQIREWLQSRV